MRACVFRSILARLLVSTGLAGAPTLAAGQIFTSSFMAPSGGPSIGVFLSDTEDLALEGILRATFRAFDLGVRAGVVDAGETDLTVGGEYRNPLAVDAVPVDVAVTAAAQAVIGDADWLGLQAGLSLGTTVVPGAFSVTPYLHPRLAFIDSPGEGDGLESELLAEIGADIEFANRVALRLSIGLDDITPDWGVGLSWARP